MVCRLTLAALAALLVLPARADTLTAPETRLLPRVIDHACLDIHPDLNGCESIFLLASASEPDTADLIIFPDRRTDEASGPLVISRAIAFNGTAWGMSPSLERSETGALLLHSEQSGIGRTPWFETLTIAWRDGEFRVIGFDHSTYDRGNGRSFSCSINLLTGDYTHELVIPDIEDERQPDAVTADAGRIAPERHLLTDWSVYAPMPEICTQAIDGFYAP